MARSRPQVVDTHYRLDKRKIRRAQRLRGAKTETETIERALDEVIAERERSRRAREANKRFLESGTQIEDAYGNLEE